MKAPHLRAGHNAEKQAARWLKHQGLKLVEQNYRCRWGELDMIMLDGPCLVIVEVRYRSTDAYGGSLHSITPSKRERLLRAADHFLQQRRRYRHHPVRFDLLAMSGDLTAPVIHWRRQAFLTGQY